MLDTMNRIETPEGVFIRFTVAGPPARFIAFLVDLTLRSIGYGICGVVLSFLGDSGMGLLMILVFIGEWFYPVLFEMFNHGRTPGKALLNLAVVLEDGSPLRWHSSLLRNLMRSVDLLPFGYAFGLISMASTQRFQRIGDLVAGTLVIYQQPQNKRVYNLPQATPTPPQYPLQLEEQRALIAFAERSGRLSQERLEELAGVLGPLVGQGEVNPLERLLENSAWLVGRRP